MDLPNMRAYVKMLVEEYPESCVDWIAEFLHERGLGKEFVEEIHGPLDEEDTSNG